MSFNKIFTQTEKTALIFALQGYTAACNAISKEDLAIRLKTDTRSVRAMISLINSDPDDGHLIMSNIDNGGYWLVVGDNDNDSVIRNYYAEESRAMSQIKKINQMKIKILSKCGVRVFDKTRELQPELFA